MGTVDGGAGCSPSGGAFGLAGLFLPIWPSCWTRQAATLRPVRSLPSLPVQGVELQPAFGVDLVALVEMAGELLGSVTEDGDTPTTEHLRRRRRRR
jgi:hypothetical protein